MRNHIRFTLQSITIECLILLEKELSISNVKVKKKKKGMEMTKKTNNFYIYIRVRFSLSYLRLEITFTDFSFFLELRLKFSMYPGKAFINFYSEIFRLAERIHFFIRKNLYEFYIISIFCQNFIFFGISRNLAFRSAVKIGINCYALRLLIN